MIEKEEKVETFEETEVKVEEKPVEKKEESKKTKKGLKKSKHPVEELDEILGTNKSEKEDLGDVPEFMKLDKVKGKKETTKTPKVEDVVPEFLKL